MPQPHKLTPNQQNRRQRILAATRDLVAQNGYSGMIMRDVAIQAKVSPTTLYNLYNSKDELLFEALRDMVTESARRAANETDGPGYQYLLSHLHHVAEQTRQTPVFVEAIYHSLVRAAVGDSLTPLLLSSLRTDALGSLAAMSQRDELKSNANADALAVALMGVFWSSFISWTSGLLSLNDLESTMLRCHLSVLIPACRGKAKTDLEARYDVLSG